MQPCLCGGGSELGRTKNKQQWSKARIESEMGGSDGNTEEFELCLPLGIVLWAVPLKGAHVNEETRRPFSIPSPILTYVFNNDLTSLSIP